MRIHPLIEPNITVGEYLDSLKVTDSEDPSVEAFWSDIIETLNSPTHIKVKSIPSSLVVNIQPWGRVSYSTSWERPQ